jgi:predicted DNA-binding transcriptional regulator YafY
MEGVSSATNDTIWRQWCLLRLMPRAPRKTTAGELQEKLIDLGIEASRRTIERDLQALSSRFPLVSEEHSRPFGWYWSKDANFEFAPRLSAPQSIALLLAKAHLRPLLPRSVVDELQPLFDMAQRELSEGAWKDWHRRTAVLSTSMTLLAPSIEPGVLADVHEALARRRQLTATYRSKGHPEGRETVIHPLGLILKGQIHYLVCCLFDYSNVRQLAVHRIANSRVSNEPSRTPPDFDFAEYAQGASKYENEGSIHLVARFTPDAAEHLRETPLSLDQEWKEIPDIDRVEVTATVVLDQTLRWWLKAFGSRVQVREPLQLRHELLADIQASLAAYDA